MHYELKHHHHVFCVFTDKDNCCIKALRLIFIDFVSGTVMLEHVLKICEKDGNFDNVYLYVFQLPLLIRLIGLFT